MLLANPVLASAVFFLRAAFAMSLVYYSFNYSLYPYMLAWLGPEVEGYQHSAQGSSPCREAAFTVGLWWLVHALVYYGYGQLLYSCYDANVMPQYKVPRARQPSRKDLRFDLLPTAKGEVTFMAMQLAYYCLFRYASSQGFELAVVSPPLTVSAFGRLWLYFSFSLWLADLQFYVVHRALHTRRFYHIHKAHHHHQSTVSFAAEVKSLTESVVVSTTDLLHFILWGGHITHLLAWVVVGTLFNLEGHSGYAFLFINDSFHDDHHVMNGGNYGVACYLDWLLGTESKSYVAAREAQRKVAPTTS